MKFNAKHKVTIILSVNTIISLILLLFIGYVLVFGFSVPKIKKHTSNSDLLKGIENKITVSISSDLKYTVNEHVSSLENLKSDLQKQIKTGKDNLLIIQIDKTVPVEHLVNVAAIAESLKLKVSIATKPN